MTPRGTLLFEAKTSPGVAFLFAPVLVVLAEADASESGRFVDISTYL